MLLPAMEQPLPAGRAGRTTRRARRPTIEDVARAAGVSRQSVSNVLNDRTARTSLATRLRIQAAMAALDYVPDSSARGLRSSRTRTIAFLVVDAHAAYLGDPLTDLIIAGVGDVARDAGYGVLIQGSRPTDSGRSLVAPILERRVEGALLLPTGSPALRSATIAAVRATDAPFVVFDEVLAGQDAMGVRSDNRAGARQLTEHLIERGHQRIAFVAARSAWAVIEQRLLGYRDALRAAGIRRRTDLEVLEAESYRPDEAIEITARLANLRARPTAVFAASDLLALGTMHAASRLGLRVPEDLAVAGFDDFPFSELLSPPLTTVRVPAYEMGVAAASLLLGSIDGSADAGRQIVLPTELRVRAST